MSRGTSDVGRSFTPPGYPISASSTSTPGFNRHHRVVNGSNRGDSIGINPSSGVPYLLWSDFDAPASDHTSQSNRVTRNIRTHQPQRSFAYTAAVRSMNIPSMDGVRHANAASHFPIHQARPVTQFHQRNNYLRHYEIPPRHQRNDPSRYEIPPRLRNAPRHYRNFPAQDVSLRIRIADIVVTLQDGVDIELTPQDSMAIRSRELFYSYLEQLQLQRILDEETREMRSGWTDEAILKCLKTRTNDVSLGKDQETKICTICQDEYQVEDKIGTLNCRHEFHRDCIKDWLLRKNICPICRRPALDSESSTD